MSHLQNEKCHTYRMKNTTPREWKMPRLQNEKYHSYRMRNATPAEWKMPHPHDITTLGNTGQVFSPLFASSLFIKALWWRVHASITASCSVSYRLYIAVYMRETKPFYFHPHLNRCDVWELGSSMCHFLWLLKHIKFMFFCFTKLIKHKLLSCVFWCACAMIKWFTWF